MDPIEPNNAIPSSRPRESRYMAKQRNRLLRAIEADDVKKGRELIIKRAIPLDHVEPRLVSRFLWHAVKAQDSVLVNELLTHKPSLSTPEGYADTMLWVAVKNFDVEISRALVMAGADLTVKLATDPSRPSYLHAVIMWWGRSGTETAMLMIDHGADVNTRDASGNSVLHTALLYDMDLRLYEKLMQHGADINGLNNNNFDLILTVACHPRVDLILPILVGYRLDDMTRKLQAMSALQYLIITNDRQKLMVIGKLLAMDLPINQLDVGGLTLLHWAVSVGRIEAVRLLLDFGADINARSRGGVIPLYEAAKLQESSITKLLIQRGADWRLLQDDGRHPIHAACATASLQNVHLLLHICGSELLNIVDNFGCTPLRYIPLEDANSPCSHLIIKHLALLQAQNRIIQGSDLEIIMSNATLNYYYGKYAGELLRMKRSKVYGNFSYFCVFSKNAFELSKLLKIEEFVKQYMTLYENLFPYYAMQMSYAIVVANAAKNIMESSKRRVTEMCHGWFNILIVQKIAGYLCQDRLKTYHTKICFTLHDNIIRGMPDCRMESLC